MSGAPDLKDEIVVTPEMLEAGEGEIYRYHYDLGNGEDVAIALYRKMAALDPSRSPKAS